MLPLLLAPLLAQLASSGLGLISQAVQAKGKEFIEDKLGVKLDEAVQTEDGKLKLLQLQEDHQEFLLANALENRKIDLQFAQSDLDNTKSARDMETKIQESEHASFLAKNIVPMLAIIVVVGGGAGIVFSPDTDVRMALVSVVTMVLGFYFGTSQTSKNKDITIAAQAATIGGAK